MYKTFVTTTAIVAGALGLAGCSKPAESPAPPAAAPAAAAPAEAPMAPPAATDAPANGPQGDGEVIKKP